MKKLLLAALLFVFSANLAYSQNSPNLNNVNLAEKNGFRDVHFGTPAAAIKGLVVVENDGDHKYYKRPTDKLFIGDGQLTKILYHFYKGQLASVSFECTGVVNCNAVYQTLEAAYGEGYKSNEYLDRWSWFSEPVLMSFQVNSITHNGSGRIVSSELAAQQKTDERERAEKSKGDL